jgi:hypothetical protein
MNTQPEALRLADELETVAGTGDHKASYKAATELRRLHEANQAMLEALKLCAVLVQGGNKQGDTAIEAAIAAIAKGEQQ